LRLYLIESATYMIEKVQNDPLFGFVKYLKIEEEIKVTPTAG